MGGASTKLPYTPEPVEAVIDALFAEGTDSFHRSAISREEGVFLRQLAAESDVRTTIEVGCANGISTLYICSGIASKDNKSHIAIDPGQTSGYQGRGVANVKRAGFDFFRLIEEGSELALPALLREGACFDMAFIDGLHTADQTLLDFYFLDRMLRVGGVMVLDDVNSSAVNKVTHYVSKYPNYKLIGVCGYRGIRRRVINVLKRSASIALWPVKKLCGEPLLREFLDDSLIHPETLWTLDFCTMAAFRKTGQYYRDTDWYPGI
jgi:predicted O-methyltransferase YrrM